MRGRRTTTTTTIIIIIIIIFYYPNSKRLDLKRFREMWRSLVWRQFFFFSFFSFRKSCRIISFGKKKKKKYPRLWLP